MRDPKDDLDRFGEVFKGVMGCFIVLFGALFLMVVAAAGGAIGGVIMRAISHG